MVVHPYRARAHWRLRAHRHRGRHFRPGYTLLALALLWLLLELVA
ncbi:hypothetical protein SAMN02746009_03768 [Hymenobacter psychrotolerans DSM 18569]|uniref:Uncharacterized protein n=1 Tax=Hymenobacter psychrotolerans DSM 18569 TaxID=1121959 RepID=A0A1M7F753_9BACT|nr:hypothetical protein SAMN02746009_03768 [Hymenobacter psychrotolerans DSM 18569]